MSATTPRADIVRMLTENQERLRANLPDLWRRTAEDLIAAGLSPADVVHSMITVALGQGMKHFGSTEMVESLRRQTAVFEEYAKRGWEHPATAH